MKTTLTTVYEIATLTNKNGHELIIGEKERCSTPFLTRELQIKTILRYNFSPIRLEKNYL